MSMRWVLTWTPSDEHPQGRKAKARIVILEYQHPEVADLKVSSPTLSRLGKVLTLQWTAFNHAELECAYAMSPFLQGDEHEMQDTEAVFTRAHDEIACAMNIPLGSAAALAKAVYGLGNAPPSWLVLDVEGRRENEDGSDSLVLLHGCRNHARTGSSVRSRFHHHWYFWTEL